MATAPLTPCRRIGLAMPLIPFPPCPTDPLLELLLGDVVRLRRAHPCGGDDWLVDRLGADIGLRCRRATATS